MTAQQMISYLKAEGTTDLKSFAGGIAEKTGTTKEKVIELIDANTEKTEDNDVAALRRARIGRHGADEPKSIYRK